MMFSWVLYAECGYSGKDITCRFFRPQILASAPSFSKDEHVQSTAMGTPSMETAPTNGYVVFFLAVQATYIRNMFAGWPGWQWRCHQACAHDEVCNSLLIEARFPKLIYSRIGSKYPVPIPYVLPCILEVYLTSNSG